MKQILSSTSSPVDMYQMTFHKDKEDIKDQDLWPTKLYAPTTRSVVWDKTPKDKRPKHKSFIQDQHIKPFVPNPSPSIYKTNPHWPKKDTSRGSGKESKYTYIDLLQTQQKNRPVPAPNVYHPLPNNKQFQQTLKKQRIKYKKLKYPNKPTYVDGYKHLSQQSPGPGFRNPHLVQQLRHVKHVTKKDNPDAWKTKHLKQQKEQKKRKMSPTSTTYVPINPTLGLFQQKLKLIENKKSTSKDSKVKGFGSDARFTYTRTKKGMTQTRAQFRDMRMTWGEQRGKSKNYLDRVSSLINSPNKSIYRN